MSPRAVSFPAPYLNNSSSKRHTLQSRGSQSQREEILQIQIIQIQTLLSPS